MLPTMSHFIWPSGFRREDFFKSTNQKQELPAKKMDKSLSAQDFYTPIQIICEK
jgi:hypothetical protein